MTNKINGQDVKNIFDKIESTKDFNNLTSIDSIDSIHPNIKKWLDNYNCGIIDNDKMKEDCALTKRLIKNII